MCVFYVTGVSISTDTCVVTVCCSSIYSVSKYIYVLVLYVFCALILMSHHNGFLSKAECLRCEIALIRW